MLTDKEIKKIAKLVAAEVIETFVREYASEMKTEPVDETDLIMMELDRLNNLMSRYVNCLLYTSPSPRDRQKSRMPSSA